MSDSSSGHPPSNDSPPTPTTITPTPDQRPEVLGRILAEQGIPAAKVSVVVREFTREFYSGPLPSVEDFRGYNDVCDGAARDILDMAGREQRHAHKIETIDAVGGILLPVLGIVAAVGVVALLLGTSIYLAMNQHENLALAALTGTGVATVAGAFLQRNRPKEPEMKDPGPPKPQQKKKKK